MWDDESGYDLDDPKHPTFADRYADEADRRRKMAKEDAADDVWSPAGYPKHLSVERKDFNTDGTV